jgi:hypothetical protein
VEQKNIALYNLTFSATLDLLLNTEGVCATRVTWNASGQHIRLVKGALPPELHSNISFGGVQARLFERYQEGIVPRMPHLELFTAQGARVPWLASQTDMLASDWAVLSDVNAS